MSGLDRSAGKTALASGRACGLPARKSGQSHGRDLIELDEGHSFAMLPQLRAERCGEGALAGCLGAREHNQHDLGICGVHNSRLPEQFDKSDLSQADPYPGTGREIRDNCLAERPLMDPVEI